MRNGTVVGLLVCGFGLLGIGMPRAHALYECPEGYYWSRETVACEQETCPTGSHRSYTLECLCDNNSVGTRDELGLLVSCDLDLLPPDKPTSESIDDTTPGSSGVDLNDASPPTEPPVLAAGNDLQPIIDQLPADQVASFRELVNRYRDTIPQGVYGYSNPTGVYSLLPYPGWTNNMIGQNDTVCGAYQDKVLRWLARIKFSSDESERALLDGFDFGPVQIIKGMHQAVVIYPRGTDWHMTGIVLDPWVEQRPRIYSIQAWDSMFFFSPEPARGTVLTHITANDGFYPTTPNADGSWEYDDINSAKPKLPERYRQLRQRFTVQSPVTVLVTDANGRQLGLRDQQTYINDFDLEAEAYIMLRDDGTYSSYFGLPEGKYTVTLTGTKAGKVHVLAAVGDNQLLEYDSVNVAAKDQLTMNWGQGAEPVLTDQAGAVVPSQRVNMQPPASEPVLTTAAHCESCSAWQIPAAVAGIAVVMLMGMFLMSKRKQH
jgi:hypothetical protein